MYAVIEVAGKQFRVAQGDRILVDGPPEAKLDPRVLLAVDGAKVVSEAAALGKVTVKLTADGTFRDKATRTMKFKPKEGRSSKRTLGHRRTRTIVKVDSLKLGS